MSNNFVNLAYFFNTEFLGGFAMHFLAYGIEMTMLAIYFFFALMLPLGDFSIVSSVLIVIIAAFLWGAFASNKDPERNGKAKFQILGKKRILLELTMLTSAIAFLMYLEQAIIAVLYSISIAFYYLYYSERTKLLWYENSLD